MGLVLSYEKLLITWDSSWVCLQEMPTVVHKAPQSCFESPAAHTTWSNARASADDPKGMHGSSDACVAEEGPRNLSRVGMNAWREREGVESWDFALSFAAAAQLPAAKCLCLCSFSSGRSSTLQPAACHSDRSEECRADSFAPGHPAQSLHSVPGIQSASSAISELFSEGLK